MFKFLKKMTKTLAKSTFEVWKDRKIQKAKAGLATKLDGAVDGTAKGVQLGVFGTIVLAGCGAGAFTLLPLACCLTAIAQSLDGADSSVVAGALTRGACMLYTIGYVMAGVLAVALLGTIIWAQTKKKRLKSKIDDMLRD